jgi:hypothetical protein
MKVQRAAYKAEAAFPIPDPDTHIHVPHFQINKYKCKFPFFFTLNCLPYV